jgi:hypothetical protein
MRKFLIGAAALAAIATPLALAGSASAYTAPDTAPDYRGSVVNGTTIQTLDMEVHLTDLPTYYHAFDLTYTPGVDGVVTFTGVGKQFDNGGELITGTVDTTNHTVTWKSTYLNMDGTMTEPLNTWGVTKAPYVVGPNGDLDWTGISDQGQNGYRLTGGFRNVPAALVAPVAGNHGECVSGAVKAGLKGQALTVIAKDVTKVGPFGSATCKV